jgi:hypothetical protein
VVKQSVKHGRPSSAVQIIMMLLGSLPVVAVVVFMLHFSCFIELLTCCVYVRVLNVYVCCMCVCFVCVETVNRGRASGCAGQPAECCLVTAGPSCMVLSAAVSC